MLKHEGGRDGRDQAWLSWMGFLGRGPLRQDIEEGRIWAGNEGHFLQEKMV